MELDTEFLRGFCSGGLWKYAVFWSFKSEKPGILTWGDGYVDKMSKDNQIRDRHSDLAESDNPIISLTWPNNGLYESYALCPIESALLSMFSHSYSLGEQIIGKVAVMGQHCWISASDFCSTLMYKYHEDWQFQFAAGIRTVLLVPVMPHGVLHLGSLCMVLESSALVTLMKDLFYKIYDPSVPHNPSATGFVYSNTLRKLTANVSVDPSDVLAHDFFDLVNSSAQLLTIDHLSKPQPLTMPEFPMLEDVTVGAYDTGLTVCPDETFDANESDRAYDTGLTACPDETFDANESDLWTNVHEVPSELTHSKKVYEPDMTNLLFMDKSTNSNSKLSCRSVINIEDSAYDNIDDFTLAYMAHQYHEHTHGSTVVFNDDVVASNLPIHSKLHRDPGAMPREDLENLMQNSRLQQKESTSHSLRQAKGNKTYFYSHPENDDYTEFLLDAITNQAGNIPNSDSSHSTDYSTSCETPNQKEDRSLRLEEWSVPDPSGGREFSPIAVNEGFMSTKSNLSFPTEINKIIAEEYMGHIIQDVCKGNSVEVKHGCRKTELQRPRPRDRQLIQDRMKELRELIPNASKCSIDALLDRTITHMLFLQTVSEKAEKLQDKLVNEEFSYKAKKELENCPLRVEELEQPSHLLIEMLCKEYDVFFETAHLFKGLEVNILKGELEYRGDELWSCFVIEAPQGLNQMQILCPLMHLLHRR